ncbi:MAG: glutamate 5-kinase [Thioalkalivibrionaceae bacterium]
MNSPIEATNLDAFNEAISDTRLDSGFPVVRRLVVKIGSALLTADGQGLDLPALERWAAELAALRSLGLEVVLVSSGAVAEGMCRLGLRERPAALHLLQAAAAVGQAGLIEAYERIFSHRGVHAAQILLTHEDLADRARYLNARSTVETLLKLGMVPIVNENDTVSHDEIRLGDNDTLSAMVANLVNADLLLILTDQQGLFDADPRVNPEARLISQAQAGDGALMAYVGAAPGRLGRGGMATKLTAAERAARSGTHTVIAYGRLDRVIDRVLKGEPLGTWLRATQNKWSARKRWLADQLHARGELVLDDGAVASLKDRGRSLLAVGVIECRGVFRRGDLVRCVDLSGSEVARGLVNYPSDDVARIVGVRAKAFFERLGYIAEPELIHRDNLVLASVGAADSEIAG